jgi:hypothetical protein
VSLSRRDVAGGVTRSPAKRATDRGIRFARAAARRVAMKIPENLEGPVVAFSVGFAVLAVAMMIKLVGLLR